MDNRFIFCIDLLCEKQKSNLIITANKIVSVGDDNPNLLMLLREFAPKHENTNRCAILFSTYHFKGF